MSENSQVPEQHGTCPFSMPGTGSAAGTGPPRRADNFLDAGSSSWAQSAADWLRLRPARGWYNYHKLSPLL
jgi:hypothetical protein